MELDEFYMNRCIELARKGKFNTSPNPRVGAVIVCDGKIIGEGYHERYGKAHAEVNAIKNVEHKALLKRSTIYVNLEPCSHFGKTPPCADLIIQSKIPRVVICNKDPFEDVNGSGIQKLLNENIEVKTNVLAEKGEFLNRRFFSFHRYKRPYIILKWAETVDGYISRHKDSPDFKDNWITSGSSKTLVHQWRAEEDAILIGSQTAIIDQPKLNTRLIKGKSPKKILIDPELEVNLNELENSDNKWLVFNKHKEEHSTESHLIQIDFYDQPIQQMMKKLYALKVQSVIVEGGTYTLNSFIESRLWDEARQFISPKTFGDGIVAPNMNATIQYTVSIENDQLNYYYNNRQ